MGIQHHKRRSSSLIEDPVKGYEDPADKQMDF
jgi:hypothetical protein